ncbi:MAG TPA: DUF3179 domain-containing (seleno)protein [Phycisphaerae bacterium]|nr:DUF3179 domain-containing (seleno)protein [Phycisphaerae bacterium]
MTHSERSFSSAAESASSKRLLTFSSGGWVLLISAVLTLGAALLVLKPVYDTGFRRAVGDGQHAETYGFDLSNLTIPREQLVASGKPKDGVRAVTASLVETMTVPEVILANKNQYVPFLLSGDPVIGVAFGGEGGETRAYPVRLLNVHEVVNDTVGGKSFAVTWSPLTGSAVVFERPDAKTEFGVSGLLYDSNTILFDRHAEAKEESLWPQLSFRAIAGPAVGKTLTVLPFEMTTWKDWSGRHPDTHVFRGLRTLEKNYNDAQDPYSLYLANDEVQFPVTPGLPREWGKFKKKTPMVVSTSDGVHWSASLAETTTAPATAAAKSNELRIHAFLFGWYAQHPSDTDYSALMR